MSPRAGVRSGARALDGSHPIPRDPLPDATLALARDPYRYLGRRSRQLDSDLFETRLLLQRTLCLGGEEAGRLFYDPRRFERQGAAPGALQKTLFGQGGVQGLDGREHAHRKRLLLSLLEPADVVALRERVAVAWRRAVPGWSEQRELALYPALQAVLAGAVCDWAGVPLGPDEARRRTHDLAALFDAAGSFGPRHWLARRARTRAERWAAGIVEALRSGRGEADPTSAVARLARWRGPDGEPLPARIAAVELLNLLRPTVAVSVYLVFVAHALHLHPWWRLELRSAGPIAVDAFVQEVRRAYPFFPAVPARVREDFTWRGHRLRAGTRVLFDLYGTNHDPRAWGDPDAFRPERFFGRTPGPFALVPQGGGDPQEHHRCAGEGVTLELMRLGVRMLVDEIDYTVPPQDLRLAFGRLPPIPRSGFRVRDLRPAGPNGRRRDRGA